MATLNRVSGKSMLIRNCACGRRVDIKHKPKEVYIICSKCGSIASTEFHSEELRDQAIERCINRWNKRSDTFYQRMNLTI